MELEKEQWINKTLESLDGIRQAVPSAGMYQNIMQRIAAEKFRIIPDTVSAGTIYRIAAAILVIITINAYSCVVFSKNIAEKKAVQTFAKEYSLSSSTESLLNM